MSTTGIESWAVDLAEVGPIYPFQGAEVLLALVGVAAWIAWHVIQMRAELRQEREEKTRFGSDEEIRRALEEE